MRFLSLSTWSLHRILGPSHWTGWDEPTQTQTTIVSSQPELTTLLELPAILAQKGFRAVEIAIFTFSIRVKNIYSSLDML